MAYGTNLIDLFSQGGGVVTKILGGEQPATLPVERPSRCQLVVNMKTQASSAPCRRRSCCARMK